MKLFSKILVFSLCVSLVSVTSGACVSSVFAAPMEIQNTDMFSMNVHNMPQEDDDTNVINETMPYTWNTCVFECVSAVSWAATVKKVSVSDLISLDISDVSTTEWYSPKISLAGEEESFGDVFSVDNVLSVQKRE